MRQYNVRTGQLLSNFNLEELYVPTLEKIYPYVAQLEEDRKLIFSVVSRKETKKADNLLVEASNRNRVNHIVLKDRK